MVLHVKVTVHPLTIAAGRVPCDLNCDRAWTGDAVATGTEVLDVGRRDHVVLFYRDEQELTERVTRYLLPAIQDGGVAIVVATPDHRRSFERYLADVGVDVAAASARGACYLALDASETMRGFMVADRPDPAGFWQAISPLLRQAAKAERSVRVFGEMVSLLWDASLIDAAIEVEAMWNELGAQYPFSLLCAYPAQPAACAHQLDALTEVCRAHTQVTGVPPEAD
jgi:MEDS: MEthanogen/methylotroph, DcmR Sensory domain